MCIVAYGVITIVIAAAAVVLAAPPLTSPSPSFDLLMPDVQPTEADTYLCNAVRVDEAHRYLTEFHPKADFHVAHHILLYGCEEPGMEPGNVWNCGEMSSHSSVPTSAHSIPSGGVCQSGHNILYAWAMDAPNLYLPTGVGFDVGQETPVKYLVLQVHYKNVSRFLPPENNHDSSGLTIHTSPTRTPKQAGVYLLVTGGSIPAHSTEYFESACEYEDDKEIVPFAYRTHAHSLGRVISGYRVRNGQWVEVGRKDPRLPEMFYNVTTPGITVKKGDILAARCTMENTKDHTVEIGNTQNDEMCNFYIMYYVEKPPTPSARQCVTPGPPTWSWKNFKNQDKINLSGVPPTASVIPGTTKPLVKRAGSPKTPYFDPLLDTVGDDNLGGQTMYMDDDMAGNDLGPEMPGSLPEQTVEQLLDEAINDMNPDELLYLIQELAREEQLDEDRRRMSIQRQRMRMQNNLMYPNLNRV